jgi:transcription antitermination factor NusG
MTSVLQHTQKRVVLLISGPQGNLQQNWYVLYTCPRTEKIVYHELVKRNYNVFLPSIRTLRVWKNRQRKWIEQVLFPGYIFIYTYQYKLYEIKRVPKVVSYVHCAGMPSVVPLKDIEGIRKMLDMGQEISVDIQFSEGEIVKIVRGPLMGHEGMLIKQKGKTKFGIQLKEINKTISIEINTSVLEKL